MKADRTLQKQVYAQLSRISRALGHAHRLELIDLLAQGERTVQDLARESGMSIANTSQHLQALKSARLVVPRRERLHVHYRLADAGVFRAWQVVRDLGHARLAEIGDLLARQRGDRRLEPHVDLAELERLAERDAAIILDLRPELEFRAGHIRGAHSIPLEALAARLGELPRDREIVAYCRGPYCAIADRGVALLRDHGFRARRLALGFPDWRAAGLPSVRR